MTEGETFSDPDALAGLTAYDRAGDKIGSVERVFLDDDTGRPEWATVKTGLFGLKETFVPLAGADRKGDALNVPHTKDTVKDAPRVDADQHLDPAQERDLYRHYGVTPPTGSRQGTGDGAGRAGHGTDRTAQGMSRTGQGTGQAAQGMGGAGRTAPQAAPGAALSGGMAGAAAGSGGIGESSGRHAGAREPAMRSGMDADSSKKNEMIRSEERLHVGTREEEVGQAHLRKVVVTEDVTTSVPVSHEEVRVVREPIREGDVKGATISEAQTEVTLHAERPVIRKDTVAVERVRLETEKVSETQEISEKVRKEEIRFDTPHDGQKGQKGMPGEDRGRQGPRH
ncbi:DUF2382 domain-containing protein [Streptomyces sp. SID5785]|uniref:DUF2382 domain-containing protein n=1 Tax=Streptomyces sp. SID5785 TaxID=2690309 RepID=UPI001361921F|nr:PRC and DUF2382 domain-containing protein [Streptomyces sp. SID5785]MZD07364.1 DUF2382 domain-containing protein [Streptomyces sp. SID5785]